MKRDSNAGAAPRHSKGRAAVDQPASTPDQAKVLPPDSPVDVPRQPPPVPKAADEANAQSRPPVDEQTESNWADGTRPQPRAKNARSSLF